MQELNYSELISGIGVRKGDILDVASGLASIILYCRSRKLKFDVNHLLDVLKESVGIEGTVMIRAFTWDFCHDVPFDILNSPSRVGVLGDAAMKRKDFMRTQHPIYSWMVWGKYQKYLCEMENTCSFGEGTPFEFLYKNSAKQICIGNRAWVFTQRHHIERLANVSYRYEKVFKGEYTDTEGIQSIRSYSMYVRDLELELEYSDYPELKEKWEKAGIRICKNWDGISCTSIKIREVSDYVMDDLVNNFGKNTIKINGRKGYQEIDSHL